MRQLGDDGTPDEALDGLLVYSVHVQVLKANCHNRWTVGEHRPDSKPLVAGTAFQRFEEGLAVQELRSGLRAAASA
ncbi:hypothetical protein ABBQ38_009504 [Trebouxia sp. C0009 RCD-2024]